MEKLRIAIQSKGRLSDDSIAFLASKGFTFYPNGRNCMVTCVDKPLDVLFLRDDDIPEYVERGVADYGIVGENVLLEKRTRVTVRKKLGFGKCSLVIAIPATSSIKNIAQLEGKRIATSYPDIMQQFLQIQRIKAEVITIKGSAEIAPNLDLADAICDLTQTGRTLKENNLMPLAMILESEAVLIQTPYSRTKAPSEFNAVFLNSLTA